MYCPGPPATARTLLMRAGFVIILFVSACDDATAPTIDTVNGANGP
jgi:hypothetical protein